MTIGSEKFRNEVKKPFNWLGTFNPAVLKGPPILKDKKYKADYSVPNVTVLGDKEESHRLSE